MTAEDQVDVGRGGERPVVGDLLVRDSHDDLRALRSEPRDDLLAGGERRIEHDVGPGPRGARGVHHREAEEADAEAAEGQQGLRRGAAEWPARTPVDHVGGEPLELRLLHALGEHRRAEVELVVAERREVQARGVERRDHLGALQERRLDRG